MRTCIQSGNVVVAAPASIAKDIGAHIERRIADRSPGDTFELVGRELYLPLPNGIGRTKPPTACLDATLGTTSTVRSWRTTTKLASMLGIDR